MIETRWIKGDEAEAAYTSLQCPWAAASSLQPNHRDLLERDVYKVHITFIEWGFWPLRGWSIRLCTWCVCVQIPNVKHCKRWYKCLVNLLWWKCKIKLCYSGFARSSENPISFLQKVRKEEKLPVAAGSILSSEFLNSICGTRFLCSGRSVLSDRSSSNRTRSFSFSWSRLKTTKHRHRVQLISRAEHRQLDQLSSASGATWMDLSEREREGAWGDV